MSNSKFKSKTESKPVNIIKIYQESGLKNSKYVLLLNELKKLLEPIKNTEVCVIGIIGTARRGKSFLLNYMLRYLTDPKNSQWMGDDRQPLEGFQWLSSGDPQTFGIWFSKPFILKQSNGKEIAVILMDTQGLFDDTYQPRDWSTIVGISLMVSSFLIVNLFTDISEDMLSFFNTYIDYGIEAKESNKTKDSEDNCPFQNLLFLIRDWNTPNDFGFGITGGEKYLNKKLVVRDHQSPESQKVRKNIQNCFQSIKCFLMPQINADIMENKDFNGSVGQLRERFRVKMEELITRILNPEELVPKMIFGTPITGEELGHQIQSVVEVFNKKELPDSHNILEANTKLSDNILIRKLRDLHLEQIQRFIESKSFINRKQLEEQNRIYKTNCIEDFESSMKSRNSELTDKLIDLLNENYQIIYKENENRRDNWSKQAVEVCSQGFMEVISAVHKDNKFVQPEALEDLFTIHSKKFIELFREGFEAEDEKLFESQLFELTKFMNNYEKATRMDNYRRINEFENSREDMVANVLEFYDQNMTKTLEENTYLPKDQFRAVEETIRTKTKNKFKNKYDFGNPSKNESFDLKVDQKLRESKKFFKEKNEKKCQDISKVTETIVKKSIDIYRQEMYDYLDLVKSSEDLDKSHERAKKRSIETFNTCPFKAPYFLNPFVEYFHSEINKLFDDFKTQLNERKENQKKKYVTAMEMAVQYYKQRISESIESTLKLKDLKRNHKIHRKSALDEYQSYFDENSSLDPLFRGYQSDLKDKIKEEYDSFQSNFQTDERQVDIAVNHSIGVFNSKVEDIVNMSSNETELSVNFTEIRENLKREISAANPTITDQTVVNKGIENFENILDQNFPEILRKFEDKKGQVFRNYNAMVNETVNDYKMKMDELLAANEYITEEELKEFHQSFGTEVISELISQLKPAFDFNINSFIDKSRQMIAEDYQRFIGINKTNSEYKFESIINLSKKYINEYQTKINECLETMESAEDLQRKHTDTLEDILQKTKISKELSNKKLIAIQVEYIDNEVSKLFEVILKKFLNRIKSFEETYQLLINQSKTFYRKEIDSHFDENKFFANEELDAYISELSVKTVEHFMKQLEENGLTVIEHMKGYYLKDLNDFIDQSNIDYNRKNEENRLLFDETLNEKAELIKCKYKQIIADCMDTILSETELSDKHYQLMADLLEEFNDSVQVFDKTLLVPHQERLQKFMSNELSDKTEELKQRIERILDIYKSVANTLFMDYVQKIKEIVESDDLYTDDEFQELHQLFSGEVTDLFETHLKQNPCGETQTHFIQFKQNIDDENQRMYEKFTLNQLKRRNELEGLIRDFEAMYTNEMKENQKSLKTETEFYVCHNDIKERLKRVFIEMSRLKSSSQTDSYIEKLMENFENTRLEFEYLFQVRIEKEATLSKNLRLDVRRHYKEEMEKFLQNKLFVNKQTFHKNHRTIVKTTIDKYSPEKGHLTQQNFEDLVKDSISDIFTKLQEDNEVRRPQSSPAIGIDLGTTNSCVAYFDTNIRGNNVVVIPNEFGYNTTPSVVSFRDHNITIIGDVAKDDIHAHPKNTISSAKRLIGRQFIDQSVQSHMNLWSYKVIENQNHNPMISVKVDGIEKNYKPEDISAQVLIKMKSIAENHLGCHVSKAVITVPAYFNDAQKEATKHAGRLAGLEVLRIINEPTAAAIAFKVDRNEDKEIRKVLIYDFGGGTFDVSILEINKGVIEVLAVGGDNNLGGDDFDTKLIQYCLQQFKDQYNLELQGVEGEGAMCRLRSQCEEHKKRLSSVESTILTITNFYENHDLRVLLTRDKFEEINYHLFVKSMNLVKTTLLSCKKEDKHILPSDIDDIVLVGGSTRIPKIQELLSQLFGGRPLNHSVNPDEAVAKGAAIQAALLNGRQSHGLEDLELRDVTPLSLGIRIKGGKLSVIIPRNTPVPREYTKQYYTSEDMQTVVGIKIFEGEKEMANDNHLLGQFDLTGIPAAPRGDQPIDVTFKLNDEGILHVKAKVVSTGSEEQIEITEHKYGWDGPQQN